MKSLTNQIMAGIDLREKEILIGQKLFSQGDTVSNFYLIETGELHLIRNTMDGNLVILHEAKSNETIAEASLFSDYYQCSAVAVKNSIVRFCPRKKMLEWLRKHPDTMLILLNSLSLQIRNLRTLSELKNIKGAKNRILAYFKAFADDGQIDLDPPIKTVAVKLGISHEAFYRALNCLEREMLIERDGRNIRLL